MSDEDGERYQTETGSGVRRGHRTQVSDGDGELCQTETGAVSGGDRAGVRRRRVEASGGDGDRCQTETGSGVSSFIVYYVYEL